MENLRVSVPGHTWITGEKPPMIDGWVLFWVNHFGLDRTEFVYRRKS